MHVSSCIKLYWSASIFDWIKHDCIVIRRVPGFNPGFWWGSYCSFFYLAFCVVFAFFTFYLFCLSSSDLLCAECCECLWIVHLWLSLRFSLSLIHMHMLMLDAVLCFWCWVQEYIYSVLSLHLSSSLFELMIYWYHLWIRLNVLLCDIFILTF